MKNDLCAAFCNEIAVRAVPVGLAVKTAFKKADGDAVIFYVVDHPHATNMARLEDDGQTVAWLEACGVDFDTQTRKKAFDSLLQEAGAEFDEVEMTIHTRFVQKPDIPKIAFGFVSLLLRLQDFLLLSQDHAVSSFREDAIKLIKSRIGSRAEISEHVPVSKNLAEFLPDLVIRADNRVPVAIFLGQAAGRVYDAILMQMAALYEVNEAVSVIALLESEHSITKEMRQRSSNRLAAVPAFAGDEIASIMRIEREVVGPAASVH